MQRESIETGSRTLQAMTDNVANMGQWREKEAKAWGNELKDFGGKMVGFADMMKQHQHMDWQQSMENAMQPYRIKQAQANISLTNANANSKWLENKYFKQSMDTIARNDALFAKQQANAQSTPSMQTQQIQNTQQTGSNPNYKTIFGNVMKILNPL